MLSATLVRRTPGVAPNSRGAREHLGVRPQGWSETAAPLYRPVPGIVWWTVAPSGATDAARERRWRFRHRGGSRHCHARYHRWRYPEGDPPRLQRNLVDRLPRPVLLPVREPPLGLPLHCHWPYWPLVPLHLVGDKQDASTLMPASALVSGSAGVEAGAGTPSGGRVGSGASDS